MQVEPIIHVRFKQFRQKNDLENIPDSLAFERFVNHTILSLHQPDAFNADSELMEFVSVGGPNDMGIDGLAIKVEDFIVKSQDEINDIIKLHGKKRINVQFIFIQSKYKTHFDKGELNNFVDGVRDFLSDVHHFPMNENLQQQLALKEYLLSDDITLLWQDNPSVLIYYVGMGRWKKPADLLGIASLFKNDIDLLNIYNFDKDNFQFIDSYELKEIYDSTQNTFSETIDTRYSMPLTGVDGVSNSCLSIVYGDELLKLISTKDGLIRKSLFNDNVRDFQGINPVNEEIKDTIKNSPEKFIILNNGVTIVCEEFKQNNSKFTITNPQIVNGCQTSNILYEAYKQGLDISKVPISLRLISTTDENIVNVIVRGTNRQNIVLEEAFESTKKFHKDLEEFFMAYSNDSEQIYYERRSKQYQYNPTIKQTEKVNLRILTQYFTGMFLNKPHQSHRHESVLLKEYKESIYLDYHSKLPYYVTAYSFIKLEKFLRENPIEKYIKSYKPHILMMLRQSIAGYVPAFSKESEVDKYSEKILVYLKDVKKLKSRFLEVVSIFKASMQLWEKDLGKSRDGTKDVEAFTKHLLNEVNNKFNPQNTELIDAKETLFSGEILNVFRDRYGNYCGFISKLPNNIFFHSNDNKAFDFIGLKGKRVLFEEAIDSKSRVGSNKAILKKILP